MATVLDAGSNKIKLSNGRTQVAQQGGWYDGQQYWGGTLSQAGVINSLSNQSGAGQKVSNEVIAQTKPENVPYIQGLQNQPQQVAQQPQQISSTQDLTTHLNQYQQSIYGGSGGDNGSGSGMLSADQIKQAIQPSTPAPTPIDRLGTYQKLQEQFKTEDLNATLNDLKAQEESLVASLRSQKANEMGKPVAMGVISGRISEETRQAQEQLDFIGRQKNIVSNELNTKYQMIQTYMNFANLDYQDSVQRYDSEFAKNIQMYNILDKQQDKAIDLAKTQQNNARANLQIYMSAIKDGSIDVNSMNTDQKLTLTKLEVQSGLPIGFISSLKKDPKADIVNMSTNNGVTQILMRNPDGSLGLQSYGTPNSGGSGTQSLKDLKADISSKMTLDEVMSKYGGSLSPNTILETYNANSPYGVARETLQELQSKYNVSVSSEAKLSGTDQAQISQVKQAISDGYFTKEEAIREFPEYAQFL